VDAFFRNAQEIFDVARAGASERSSDFALLIRPDGGLHLIMDSPVSLEAAAVHGGARTAYFVSRSGGGVRVTGQAPGRSCVLEEGGRSSAAFRLLRDQPLYQKMVSGNGGGSSRGGSGGNGGGTSSSGVIVRAMLAA
jgi:hypothetical protein